MSDEDMQLFRKEIELGGEWRVDPLHVYNLSGAQGLPPDLEPHKDRLGVAFQRPRALSKVIYTKRSDGGWVQDPVPIQDDWLEAIKYADEYEVST